MEKLKFRCNYYVIRVCMGLKPLFVLIKFDRPEEFLPVITSCLVMQMPDARGKQNNRCRFRHLQSGYRVIQATE